MTSPPPEDPANLFSEVWPLRHRDHASITAELDEHGAVIICRHGVMVAAMSLKVFQWFCGRNPGWMPFNKPGGAESAPLPAPSLTDEELEYLESIATCEACGHSMAFHDMEYDCCEVPGCRCRYGQLQPERETPPPPLTGCAPVLQPGGDGIIRYSFDGLFSHDED